MKSCCLVLVESNTSGTGRLFARKAKELGFKPILLAKDPTRYAYVQEDDIEVIQVDTQNQQALLEVCNQLPRLTGITSSSEYYVAIAASVARQLSLPSPEPTAICACRDKEKQRILLQEAEVGIPKFRSVDNVIDAIAAAQSIGLPVVVKPVLGSGSVGVKLCYTDNEVAEQAKLLLQQGENERGLSIPKRILIEELVEGIEFSIETFNNNIIGITEKILGNPPYFVEIGHNFPAKISNANRERIEKIVYKTLEALDLNWGASHVELRLTKKGRPKIIEVNPRLAGGYIPQLVHLAFGVDLIEATLWQVLGKEPQLKKINNGYACLRFILPPYNGKLVKFHGVEEALNISGVTEVQLYSKEGESVKFQGNFTDRVGHIIASCRTETDAKRIVDLAHQHIHLLVEPSLVIEKR